MNIPVEVVDRKTIATILDLERDFIAQWLDAGEGAIPQMPHIPGKPVKFHIASVREWLLAYFQKGGVPKTGTKGGRTK